MMMMQLLGFEIGDAFNDISGLAEGNPGKLDKDGDQEEDDEDPDPGNSEYNRRKEKTPIKA